MALAEPAGAPENKPAVVLDDILERSGVPGLIVRSDPHFVNEENVAGC